MDVKGKVFLQLFNKRKIFSLFVVKLKTLGFSAPLICNL